MRAGTGGNAFLPFLTWLCHRLELQEEVEELKLKAREYALENRDLKNELNAFDPAFFEEIESMKWELAEAKKRVQELEAI